MSHTALPLVQTPRSTDMFGDGLVATSQVGVLALPSRHPTQPRPLFFETIRLAAKSVAHPSLTHAGCRRTSRNDMHTAAYHQVP